MYAGGGLSFNKKDLAAIRVQWEKWWDQESVWSSSFALIPHKCHLSKKWVWMRMGYRGALDRPGKILSHRYTRWHHYDHHIMWELRRQHHGIN